MPVVDDDKRIGFGETFEANNGDLKQYNSLSFISKMLLQYKKNLRNADSRSHAFLRILHMRN